MNHGTASTYRMGCRCWSCTEANTEYGRQTRARLRAQGMGSWQHGTVNAYVTYGCRCARCREAKTAYQRRWRAKRSGRRAFA